MTEITTPYQAGDKVQYRLFDKKGKEHWLKGTIHAVRRYEDAATNMIKNITYLVDTGRDERVDATVFDHRDREVMKRAKALAKTSALPLLEAIEEVVKQPDLPDSKMDVEYTRQPEQIELPAEHIKASG